MKQDEGVVTKPSQDQSRLRYTGVRSSLVRSKTLTWEMHGEKEGLFDGMRIGVEVTGAGCERSEGAIDPKTLSDWIVCYLIRFDSSPRSGHTLTI